MSSVVLGDLDRSYPDLRRVRELLDRPGSDTEEPPGFPGFYKWNEEGTSLQKLNVSRKAFRDVARHELKEGRRNDSFPQNRELRNRIYQAYTDDMFDAAEAANPARAHDFRLLKDNYTRAMELIERTFSEEFAKKLVERAENHPLLAETDRRKNREKKRTARERQRVESAPGLGNFLFFWFIASLLIPELVLSSLDIDKGFVFAAIALVASSISFLPVLLPHKLLKRYQFRKFDRHYPPLADESDHYAAERKSLAELIAEECGFTSSGWVEEVGLKKAREAKAEAERRRKAAGKQEPSFEELSAEGDVRNAELTVEIERRAREATAEEAKQNAEAARKEQRDAVAAGLNRLVVGIPPSLAVIEFLASVILSGYMITRWLGRHEIGIFLASCLTVFFLFGFLNDLVRKHQLRRFDRDYPPPTEDAT